MLEREYSVQVHPDADDKMDDHINFLKQTSVSAAERLSNSFCEGLSSLDYNPEGYPRYFTRKSTKSVYHYSYCDKLRYRIVFRVIDDTVLVYDVQDCRQHPNRSLV
jgi:hypothetical protein